MEGAGGDGLGGGLCAAPNEGQSLKSNEEEATVGTNDGVAAVNSMPKWRAAASAVVFKAETENEYSAGAPLFCSRPNLLKPFSRVG